MLFHMKDQKAAVLENDLNKLQKDGPAAWAELPEDELFTPAGFRAEQAEVCLLYTSPSPRDTR